MIKNTASQKWIVFAFDATDNLPKTGDAINITGNLRLDGAGANAIDDYNPTELESGYYIFDITQAESNADLIVMCSTSSTTDIEVIGVPRAVWTEPTGRKYPSTLASTDVTGLIPASLASGDVTGNINAHIKATDDIAFSPTQIGSLLLDILVMARKHLLLQRCGILSKQAIQMLIVMVHILTKRYLRLLAAH